MCSVFGPGESTFELVIPGQSDATMVLIAFPDVNNVHIGRGVGFERIAAHNYTDERDLDVVFSNATIITMGGEVGHI
jgi:hypothetical protein